VITGFNTDIEHDGVVYHVQTEDKGLESPIILSLVYSGGAILASKRSPYVDLITAGFSEEVLGERLKRQHRLICAAIRAGRLEELRRMGARAAEGSLAAEPTETEKEEPSRKEAPPEVKGEQRVAADQSAEASTSKNDQPSPAPPMPGSRTDGAVGEPQAKAVRAPSDPAAYSIHDPRRQSPLGVFAESADGLRVTLLDEQELRAGDALTLAVLVSYRSGDGEKPLSGIPVSVKVLGTSFRPVILSLKTQRDGVAVISTQIPPFRSGRAAILVRAVKDAEAVEIRRVIYPAR
jgi:hypothetical protein